MTAGSTPTRPGPTPRARTIYDPARANAALDAAGIRRGDDGVRRTADGARLEFTISVAANEPQHTRSAQLIAQQVEAIGVKINVESMDAATLRQRRGTGNYDSFITNLESHAHADPDALSFFFHSPAPGAPVGSFGGYSNPQFDRLVEQARVTIDNGERKRPARRGPADLRRRRPGAGPLLPERRLRLQDRGLRRLDRRHRPRDPHQAVLHPRLRDGFRAGGRDRRLGRRRSPRGPPSASSSAWPWWAAVSSPPGAGAGSSTRPRRPRPATRSASGHERPPGARALSRSRT